MGSEGVDPDDGIVAPKIAARTLPEGHAPLEQRTAEAGIELLMPREQAGPSDRVAHRLDKAGSGIGLHDPDQPCDRVTRHQAVGVEDNHKIVGCTPSADELGDVARLPAAVARAVSIEDADPRIRRL